MLVQRVRNGKQQFVFGFGICLCKTLLCACGLIGLAAHRVEHLRTQFIAHKNKSNPQWAALPVSTHIAPKIAGDISAAPSDEGAAYIRKNQ